MSIAERFWVHFEHHTCLDEAWSWDESFETLAEAEAMAEDLVDDGDAHRAIVRARVAPVCREYNGVEWIISDALGDGSDEDGARS
jgi:hypothetical protein